MSETKRPGRKPTPAPERKDTGVSDALIVNDFSAANELAVARREAEARTRAVAQQLGYQLPADCTDPDLIQRDISANMRRSVEAVLQVGIGLRVLKEASPNWQNFVLRLEALSVDLTLAKRLMQAGTKFSQGATSHLVKAAGSQSKLLELLVLDDEQIQELELTGQTGELDLDDVARMSVKELRAALRETKAERQADQSILDKKQARIDKLERDLGRIDRLAPDDKLAHCQKLATEALRHADAILLGELRQRFIAVDHAAAERGTQTLFLAGLVGQLQSSLAELREEFGLPDVSRAADAELVAEVAQWAKS